MNIILVSQDKVGRLRNLGEPGGEGKGGKLVWISDTRTLRTKFRSKSVGGRGGGTEGEMLRGVSHHHVYVYWESGKGGVGGGTAGGIWCVEVQVAGWAMIFFLLLGEGGESLGKKKGTASRKAVGGKMF